MNRLFKKYSKNRKYLFILMSHLFYLLSIFMLPDFLAPLFYNTSHKDKTSK